MTIVFEPSIVTKYSAMAYCEIQGSQNRLPLKLTGTGLGPEICANIDVIDFDLIFLKLEHTYEVRAIFDNNNVEWFEKIIFVIILSSFLKKKNAGLGAFVMASTIKKI